jgi:putative iron-only hydrogenase system regulator
LGEKRIGVIGIVISDRKGIAPKVNSILSEHSELIMGRMGLPFREKNLSTIALIVDGDTDEIGSLTGKLGSLNNVQVKSALVTK